MNELGHLLVLHPNHDMVVCSFETPIRLAPFLFESSSLDGECANHNHNMKYILLSSQMLCIYVFFALKFLPSTFTFVIFRTTYHIYLESHIVFVLIFVREISFNPYCYSTGLSNPVRVLNHFSKLCMYS
jgi:hypothetical protein